MEQQKETYTLLMQCDNCDEEQETEIQKGQTPLEYAKDAACQKCGCHLHSMMVLKERAERQQLIHLMEN